MISKNTPLAEWLASYLALHGHYPKKPIYVNFEGLIPGEKQECIVTFSDEIQNVEYYDKGLHGDINPEKYYIFELGFEAG